MFKDIQEMEGKRWARVQSQALLVQRISGGRVRKEAFSSPHRVAVMPTIIDRIGQKTPVA